MLCCYHLSDKGVCAVSMSSLNFGTRGLIDLFMNHGIFVQTSLIIQSEGTYISNSMWQYE